MEAFEQLGYTLTCAGDIPGFYTDLDTGIPGPTVLIMGEMDSLIMDGPAVTYNEDGTASVWYQK